MFSQDCFSFSLLFVLYYNTNTVKQPRSVPERMLMCAGTVIGGLLGIAGFTKNDGNSALMATFGTFPVAYGLIFLDRTVYHSGTGKARASAGNTL